MNRSCGNSVSMVDFIISSMILFITDGSGIYSDKPSECKIKNMPKL